MLDVLIFVKCSGAMARVDNLFDCLASIEKKIGIKNYMYYLAVDPDFSAGTIKAIKDLNIEEKIHTLSVSYNSWAYDYNLFFSYAQEEAKWIMTVHDDVEFRTDNFFLKVMNMAQDKEDQIGWIMPTIDYYYRVLGEPIGISGRELYTLDRFKYPCLFECHNFNNNLHNNGRAKNFLHLLDMPNQDKLVKIPGIMSAVIMSPVNSAKKIGPAEDWTKYTILVDEDWSFRALQNKLWNVWASGIYINHPNRANLRFVWNRWEKDAHAKFLKKWQFGACKYPEGLVKELCAQYKDTYIPWPSTRNTYDWDYV